MSLSWVRDYQFQTARLLHAVPQRLRVVVYATLLIGIGLGLHLLFHSRSATLKVEGRHNLRRPTITVSIDGTTEEIPNVGSARKRLGFLGASTVGFSETLRIDSGKHTARVRVRSVDDNFDETRQIEMNAPGNTTSILTIQAERGREVSLAYESGNSNEGSAYFVYLFSVLATIGGTVLSTAIGFVVQEFLKSRKLQPSALAQVAAPDARQNG